MIVSIWDFFQGISEKIEKFMIANYDEPFLWIGLFAGLLAIALYGIAKLADK